MTSVTFGGLVFDDEATSGFTLSKLVGWYDAAPARYNADERPQGHGTFKPGKMYRGARVVSLQGAWSGSSLDAAYAAREALMGVQSAGETSPFVVRDPLGVRYVTAGLANAPTADDGLYQAYFKFAFDVTADDPMKYAQAAPTTTLLATTATGTIPGPTPSDGLFSTAGYDHVDSSGAYYSPAGLAPAGDGLYVPKLVQPSGGGISFPLTFPITFGNPAEDGRVTTVNTGTADAFTVFTVQGGTMTGGFTLVEVPTGRRIVVSRDVVRSDVVQVDMRTGTLTVNGYPTPGYLDRAEWWSVPPKSSTEVQFLANGPITGTPTLTELTEPAYL